MLIDRSPEHHQFREPVMEEVLNHSLFLYYYHKDKYSKIYVKYQKKSIHATQRPLTSIEYHILQFIILIQERK